MSREQGLKQHETSSFKGRPANTERSSMFGYFGNQLPTFSERSF